MKRFLVLFLACILPFAAYADDQADLIGLGVKPAIAEKIASGMATGTFSGTVTAGTGLTATTGDVTITSGDLTVTNGVINIPAAKNLGFVDENGANTACNTTCTAGCVIGFDQGSSVFVDCADATADTCACAGAGS